MALLRAAVLAFYRPFPSAREEALRDILVGDSDWGIYLISGGVELLAREVFSSAGLDDTAALQCAAALLLGHELGHLIVDVALAREDCAQGYTATGTERSTAMSAGHRRAHHGAAAPSEEAFCASYALRFLTDLLAEHPRFSEDERDAAMRTAAEHVADGPPGYRAGAALSGPQLFEALVHLLGHIGVESPEAGALSADLDRRRLTSADVPVRLVVTPGSAYSRDWSLGQPR